MTQTWDVDTELFDVAVRRCAMPGLGAED